MVTRISALTPIFDEEKMFGEIALVNGPPGTVYNYDTVLESLGAIFLVNGATSDIHDVNGAVGGLMYFDWDADTLTGWVSHDFFTSGTFTPDATLTFEQLVVGGGGKGGNSSSGAGGGGGGGDVLANTPTISTPQTVTIGAGSSTYGVNGGDTDFGAVTATGGGYGGDGNTGAPGAVGGNGATGGGGGGTNTGGGGAGGTGITYNGAAGTSGSTRGGGGGAGAGEDGAIFVFPATLPNGGDGIQWVDGDGGYYGGGGGGGLAGSSPTYGSAGGLGGGGAGAEKGSGADSAVAGTDGLGGGGGGGGTAPGGADGGDGVAKAYYEIAG